MHQPMLHYHHTAVNPAAYLRTAASDAAVVSHIDECTIISKKGTAPACTAAAAQRTVGQRDCGIAKHCQARPIALAVKGCESAVDK